MSRASFLISVLFFGLTSLPAAACGVRTDCEVQNGNYRIYLPESWTNGEDDQADFSAPRGAVLFFHGWKGSSASTINNRRLREAASDLGIALVAPNGVDGAWSYPQSPVPGRDGLAYTKAVLDDLEQRFGIRSERVMAAGFSLGGSMVWNLSCYLGDQFAGFSPIAGTFWAPLPTSCPSDVPNLIHYHGTKDGTFPLAGRSVANGRFQQGDTLLSLDMWKSQGTCETEAPQLTISGALHCERRSACGGGVLELCLHDGGHIYRADWIKRSWKILASIKGW